MDSILFGLRMEHVFGKNLFELGGTFVFMSSNFQGCILHGLFLNHQLWGAGAGAGAGA